MRNNHWGHHVNVFDTIPPAIEKPVAKAVGVNPLIILFVNERYF